jgi:hypothetical protein
VRGLCTLAVATGILLSGCGGDGLDAADLVGGNRQYHAVYGRNLTDEEMARGHEACELLAQQPEQLQTLGTLWSITDRIEERDRTDAVAIRFAADDACPELARAAKRRGTDIAASVAPFPEPSPPPTRAPQPQPVRLYDGTGSGGSKSYHDYTDVQCFLLLQEALNNSNSQGDRETAAAKLYVHC